MKCLKSKSLVLSMALSLLTLGCAQEAQQPKPENSQQAIQNSKGINSVEEQVKYLMREANTFVNSEKFDEAVALAQYILSELDQNSQEAKSILKQAEEKLKALAAQKLQEMGKDLDMKGSFSNQP